ncbi:response regulator [Rhodohalobacter mucosus]|uniref:Response regulator n=1 Tax=Rhodohalobacter mucosus TaxID=2079485 RepID=A0A316TW32_9BACT|nr:response regulator [Rhodohalobacter mucosus]PWN07579.1 response regulator [Rhodohalobacter mucosus]
MADQPKKILLVEDDGVQQVIMERFINKLGHTVLATVSEGKAAVQSALKLKGVDLIIMDIRLSDDVDGIEAMKQIRQKSDVKVIYVTGNTEAATKERASETKFEDYIEKPVTPEKLKGAIQKAFS